MWQLIINGPGYFETVYDLPEGVTHIGRADENEIVLSGDLVSRTHVRLVVRGGSLQAEDMGSRNGSVLNGQSLVDRSPLQIADVLVIGENTLTVQRAKPVEAQPTELLTLEEVGLDGAVPILVSHNVRESAVHRLLDNAAPPRPSKPEPHDVPFFKHDESPVQTDEREKPTATQWRSLVLMYQVAESLANASSLRMFLEHACNLVQQRVDAMTVSILHRTEKGTYVPMVTFDTRAHRPAVAVSESIVATAVRQAQAIAVADAKLDARFAERKSVVASAADQVLCIPIGTEAPFPAVLYINRASTSVESLDALLDVCAAVAQLIATGFSRFAERISLETRMRLGLEHHFSKTTADALLLSFREAPVRLNEWSTHTCSVLVIDLLWTPPLTAAIAEAFREAFGDVVNVVRSFDGVMGAVVGNRFMAWFGPPSQHADVAVRSVRAGLAIELAWSRDDLRRRAFPLRMGVSTGEVVSGLNVDAGRVEPSLVGETPLVAGFLCDLAERDQILVCGNTLAALGARFDAAALGQRSLSLPWLGENRAVSVFDIAGEDDTVSTLPGHRI